MARPSPSRASPGDPSPDRVGAAFRELHGRRLHGFALLLTLGHRPLAARLTADALARGAARADELRHPERAAAWLRARVLSAVPRRHHAPSPAEEHAGLDPLDVPPTVADGLAVLGTLERAALIATDVERLDPRDVGMIVGRRGARFERLLTRARRDYLTAGRVAAASSSDGGRSDGPLVRRIGAVAARTIG